MNSSMTVTGVEVVSLTEMVLRCSDMSLDEWNVNFRHRTFYSNLMASHLVSDLQDGRAPFLTCGYNEARDEYVVSDDHGTEVLLSKFSNWTRI